MGDKKICIVVSHNDLSQGATTLWGESEYQYNSKVANLQKDVTTYWHSPNTNYSLQCAEMANALAQKNIDLILCLHLNASGVNAQGSEGLYCEGNKLGFTIAHEFSKAFEKSFGIKYRYPKALKKGDRGYGEVAACKATTVILEPFFCDHEYAYMLKEPYKYAKFLNEFTKLCKESLLP